LICLSPTASGLFQFCHGFETSIEIAAYMSLFFLAFLLLFFAVDIWILHLLDDDGDDPL
jgi:hypothetical protein